MKKTIWMMVVFSMIFILQSTGTVAAQSNGVLLNPAGGLYNFEFVNLTGKNLQVTVNGASPNSNYVIGSQLNVLGDNNTIYLNSILNKNANHPPIWNGFILGVSISAGGINGPSQYVVAEGLQSQTQLITINDYTNTNSPTPLATLNFAYVYNASSTLNPGGIVSFVQSLLSPISKIGKSALEAAGGDEDALTDIPESIGDLLKTIVTTASANNNTLIQTGVTNDKTLTTVAQTLSTPFTNYSITNYCQLSPVMSQGHGVNPYLNEEYTTTENIQVSTANTTTTIYATYTDGKGNKVAANRTYTGPALILVTDAIYAQNTKNPNGVDKVYVVLLSGLLYHVYDQYSTDTNKSNLSGLTIPQLMYYYGTTTPTGQTDPLGSDTNTIKANVIKDFANGTLVLQAPPSK